MRDLNRRFSLVAKRFDETPLNIVGSLIGSGQVVEFSNNKERGLYSCSVLAYFKENFEDFNQYKFVERTLKNTPSL